MQTYFSIVRFYVEKTAFAVHFLFAIVISFFACIQSADTVNRLIVHL